MTESCGSTRYTAPSPVVKRVGGDMFQLVVLLSASYQSSAKLCRDRFEPLPANAAAGRRFCAFPFCSSRNAAREKGAKEKRSEGGEFKCGCRWWVVRHRCPLRTKWKMDKKEGMLLRRIHEVEGGAPGISEGCRLAPPKGGRQVGICASVCGGWR